MTFSGGDSSCGPGCTSPLPERCQLCLLQHHRSDVTAQTKVHQAPRGNMTQCADCCHSSRPRSSPLISALHMLFHSKGSSCRNASQLNKCICACSNMSFLSHAAYADPLTEKLTDVQGLPDKEQQVQLITAILLPSSFHGSTC